MKNFFILIVFLSSSIFAYGPEDYDERLKKIDKQQENSFNKRLYEKQQVIQDIEHFEYIKENENMTKEEKEKNLYINMIRKKMNIMKCYKNTEDIFSSKKGEYSDCYDYLKKEKYSDKEISEFLNKKNIMYYKKNIVLDK